MFASTTALFAMLMMVVMVVFLVMMLLVVLLFVLVTHDLVQVRVVDSGLSTLLWTF